MTTLHVSFPNPDGLSLSGRLELPATSAPRAYALFAHCFTCSKDLRAVTRIARTLTAHGFAVLRFDFTGLGASEGEFADTTFTSNTEDLVAAAQWLASEHEAPALLIGHSLGGAAVLRAASQIPSARAVVTLGAPAEASHVRGMLDSSRDEIEQDGSARVTLAGRTFCIRKEFLDDLDAVAGLEPIRELGKALLVMHAPQDQTVGVDNARVIYQAARHPKSFVSLDDADHLLSRPKDAEYAGRMIAAWVERYIDDGETDPQEAQIGAEPVEDGQVHTATGAAGFRTEVRAGRHRMVADEPSSVGGTDEGPTPYGFLLSALGACTSMTLRMYADRKGWPLTEARVRLSHSKVHATDSTGQGGRQGRIDQIDREIELIGPLDSDQRARLLEIADKCPVHRTLHGEVLVRSSLSAPRPEDVEAAG